MLSRKILVIDNEDAFSDMCRNVLEAIGHTVTVVDIANDAVELAGKRRFDLALISSHGDGAQCLNIFNQLRQLEPNLIGIVVAESPHSSLLIEAMNSGYTGVLEKPVTSEMLLQRVQSALALTRLREENTRLRTLIPLYQLANTFLKATSSQEIYDELVRVIHRELKPSSVSLMLLDKNCGDLRIVSSKGLKPGLEETVRLQPGEKIAGWVFSHGKPLILNRSSQSSTPFTFLLERNEIAAAISYPLVLRGEATGVVNVSNRSDDVEYSQADMELLSVICGQAIMALENVLAILEREKAVRLRTMFEQYVAPEVAEFLLNRDGQMLDVGEVKDLTVLFADIRNFTSLVQHISPEELRAFLNEFFELFTNVVFNFQGTLDKFMGDAALVLFGAPVPIDHPPRAAVQAAISIMEGFEILRDEWAKKSPWFLKIGVGIGISSGEVYLGNVGSEKRLDFTVIGTNVNIAQRLASETNSGQILITESVSRSVADTFTVKKEGARLLRGLEHDIQVYSVPMAEDATVLKG